ncbi:MAG: ATP/GTP-binding protein [Cyanobacteriota bacterium]|nr:ATP/GTP-binding protein [Cyanobacteriota bacterium]
MQHILRVVVTGPVGAGKSTFIRTISEIEVVDTDRKATDETADLKPDTTVAMDFGRLTLGDGMWLHLYGTPGQDRFNFMWDLLIRRAHGYILLLPAHRPGQFQAAKAIKSFMQERATIPLVVGITHVDHPDAWDPEDIKLFLEESGQADCPYATLHANDPPSIAQTLLLLVEQMMALTAVE